MFDNAVAQEMFEGFMPKPKGYPFNATRLNREEVRFEFRYAGQYLRRTCRLDALMAFLTEGGSEESNLGVGAVPMSLREFVESKYLPFAALPRLSNPKSYLAEKNLTLAVCLKLGDKRLHEILARDAEACKMDWLKSKRVNNTIKKRLNCLRRILAYAESSGLVKKVAVPSVRGLPVGDRSHIWLRREEIDRLLGACHPVIKPLVEYMVLTGARVGEALDFRVGDLRNGKLYIPTEKQGRSPREAMRELDAATLGPRFAVLMAGLKPHPQMGFYFYANANRRTCLSVSYTNRRFVEARTAVGLEHVHQHDLRGTFAMHRAMVVGNFRQLQAELGHGDPRSVQAYLDRAVQFDRSESIFSA